MNQINQMNETNEMNEMNEINETNEINEMNQTNEMNVRRERMIVAVEPLCRGAEHALINAALLATARLAFPEDPLLFLAEPAHLEAVGRLLAREGIQEIQIAPIQLPSHTAADARAILPEYRFCREALSVARRRGADRVIFCATNGTEVFCLKLLLRTAFPSLTAMAILHTDAQHLRDRTLRRPWQRILSFRNALKYGNLRRMRIVVMGESVRKEVLEQMPDLGPRIHAMDFAYLFPEPVVELPIPPLPPLRFAFVGVGTYRKGIDHFFRLAERFQAGPQRGGAEFVMAGQIQDERFRGPCPFVSLPPHGGFLSPEEMTERTRGVHYILYPYRSEGYHLVASAAILDALAHLKPVIALPTPYISHCFQRMGDIGYLCHDYEDLARTIESLLAHFPRERYEEQRQNLYRARDTFRPQRVAPRLREILSS